MYKAGDKFEVVSGGEAYGVSAGDIVTWDSNAPCDAGYFKSSSGYEFPAAYGDNIANISTTVRPLRTEAEKRGAKFGVTGVDKTTGKKIVFNSVGYNCPLTGEEVWVVMYENISYITIVIEASKIRLDHEPEYKEIPFSEATHEQRMDAGNLIIDGGLGVSEIMKFDMAGYVYTLRGSTKVYTDTTILTVRIPT